MRLYPAPLTRPINKYRPEVNFGWNRLYMWSGAELNRVWGKNATEMDKNASKTQDMGQKNASSSYL